MGWGMKVSIQMVYVTWPPCPYMVKPLKLFFSGTERPITMKLGMQQRVLEYSEYSSTNKFVKMMPLC